MHRACLVGFLALSAALGCGLPRDPEGTLERVRASGVLRAGAVPNPPWVTVSRSGLSGPEVALVEALAAAHGATVQWTIGAEEPLLDRLRRFDLDVVAGGITRENPFVPKFGASRPLFDSGAARRHVILVPPGENRFLLALDRALHEQRGRMAHLLGSPP